MVSVHVCVYACVILGEKNMGSETPGASDGDQGFVKAAQEAISRIQASAFKKKSERDLALKVLSEARKNLELSKGEVAAVALNVKQKSCELKLALDLCQRAKAEVNAALKSIADAADAEEREQHQDKCLAVLRGMSKSKAPEDLESTVGGTEIDGLSIDSPVLNSVIEDLHTTHKSLSFQSDLLKASEQKSSDTGYSLDNFAYGTTPYESFLAIFQDKAVSPHVSTCLEKGKIYCVYGSSIGWLCFYGNLTYGLRTVGYEILPNLVQVSKQIADKHDLRGLHFHVKDMLETDLEDIGILFLTSQCWDTELKKKTYHKIQRELPQDALVIDYSPALKHYEGFESILKCRAPVSWNSSQEFHCFVKTSS